MPQLIATMIALLLAQDAPPPPAFRIRNGVSQPTLIHKVEPEYSEEARNARWQGTVELAIVVGVDGAPLDLRVTRGLGFGLDEKAIEAVKQWRFRPGMKDGAPVPVIATVQVNFRLLDAPWLLNKIEFDTSPDMTRPVLLHAEYPKEKPTNVGAIRLMFTIDERGVPSWTGEAGPVLAGGLIDAVTKWRFVPAMKNGVATPVRATFDFVASAVGPPATSAFNAGAGVSMPQLISKIEPTYSPEALKAKLIGSASIQIVVGVDGSARDFRVMKGLGLGLDEAAVEAVKQWRFQPGQKEGKPVPVIATVQVNFNLLRNGPWQLSKAVFDTPPGAIRPVLTHAEFPKARPKDHATVSLTFTIDEHGEPRDLSVGQSDSELDKEIIAAAKKWRFTPATKDGAPIAVQATFDFTALRVM